MSSPQTKYWLKVAAAFGAVYAGIWTAIESGERFDVPFIKDVPNTGLTGYLLIFGVAAALIAIFVVTKAAFTAAVRREARRMSESRRRIGKDVVLIQSQSEIAAIQLELVRTAKTVLTSTGSRSHNRDYLTAIEKRIEEASTLQYTRILFGPIRRDELRTHCASLTKASAQIACRAKILQITDVDRLAESFFVSNDDSTLLIIPSLNAIGRFDCGLVLRGQYHKLARNVLDSYAKAATTWNPSLP